MEVRLCICINILRKTWSKSVVTLEVSKDLTSNICSYETNTLLYQIAKDIPF